MTTQARLQQYVNRELPNVPVGVRKGRGTRDQIANIHQITEKAREFQKNIYFCFIDYIKAFDWVDHNKLWKILRDGNTTPPYPWQKRLGPLTVAAPSSQLSRGPGLSAISRQSNP